MNCGICILNQAVADFKHVRVNSQGQDVSVSFSLCNACIERAANKQNLIVSHNRIPEGGC